VGIAYDGSRDAEAALSVARTVAENARGRLSRIDIAYVDTSASAAGESDADAIDARRTALIEWWLTDHAADLPGPVRAARLIGEPADELASLSQDLDLLIVGSRGRAPLRRAITGSVSRALTTASRCPLLVVPRTGARTVLNNCDWRQDRRQEFWRPEERKILVRKQPQYGWGWTINFAEIVRRLRRARIQAR
jgi:nucleotide-binding universal stress UspA family protein